MRTKSQTKSVNTQTKKQTKNKIVKIVRETKILVSQKTQKWRNKMSYYAGEYDIAVIGAGHAGCEAALAAARLGKKTLLFSISLEAVANMPCNPHIGGSSKGHLVREIDALGGEMGKNIDKTFIQIKMLNKSKGPAVYSLRAQADRKMYHSEMKHTLEKQENLYIKQAEITNIEVKDGKVESVTTNIGAIYKVKAVILATGTYLKGKIHIGEVSFESGPDGVFPAVQGVVRHKGLPEAGCLCADQLRGRGNRGGKSGKRFAAYLSAA